MSMRKLKLYFKDQIQNAKSLTIDYPKADYDGKVLYETMDKIIASKVLLTKNGPIVAKTKAEIETIDKKEITLG